MPVSSTAASKHTASGNASVKWNITGVEGYQSRAYAKTSHFSRTGLALAASALVSKYVFQSTVIFLIVGGLVFLKAGDKLPDKLEPVTGTSLSAFLTLGHIW